MGILQGIFVYIVLEVFYFKLYDGKVDIYSFGLILWEMWYGQWVFVEFKGMMVDFFRLVDKGGCLKDVEGSRKFLD